MGKEHVLRGQWKSEPAVKVRDPYGLGRAVDLVKLQDRRL